jgi:Uri superfamily endonuclease
MRLGKGVMRPMTDLGNRPGTYALILKNDSAQVVTVGQLGPLILRPSWYVYLGSALGPGGLAARVGRHIRPEKKRRWHIDYVRPHAELREVWFTHGIEDRECQWAQAFAEMSKAELPFPRFGASDCRCASHLIWLPRRPSLAAFCRLLGCADRKVQRLKISADQAGPKRCC